MKNAMHSKNVQDVGLASLVTKAADSHLSTGEFGDRKLLYVKPDF